MKTSITTKKPDTPKSQEKKTAILEVTRVMLAEEGYSELSLRKVASKVGIHLKTLQYYYPTKEGLLQSVLEYADSLYVRTYEELRPKTYNPEVHFDRYVNYLINTEKDQTTAGFFYQLWDRAHRDEHAKKIMHEMYERHTDHLAELMAPLNENLDKKTLKQRAVILAALIDGMMLFIGYGKQRPKNIGNIEKEVLKLAKKLASSEDFLDE
ncbi:TetR/AcrR family transcriptional regulator [Dasania marina]|uniref:TetR/AcrR family transcriptional regulator n=1 Tax=Dasania marina TaxID=471499 RepID=UPI0030DC1E46|tara:strand:- start:119505 stop:120134 length:630 start_codon:yes stop_codon:yes gene_type:complete